MWNGTKPQARPRAHEEWRWSTQGDECWVGLRRLRAEKGTLIKSYDFPGLQWCQKALLFCTAFFAAVHVRNQELILKSDQMKASLCLPSGKQLLPDSNNTTHSHTKRISESAWWRLQRLISSDMWFHTTESCWFCSWYLCRLTLLKTTACPETLLDCLQEFVSLAAENPSFVPNPRRSDHWPTCALHCSSIRNFWLEAEVLGPVFAISQTVLEAKESHSMHHLALREIESNVRRANGVLIRVAYFSKRPLGPQMDNVIKPGNTSGNKICQVSSGTALCQRRGLASTRSVCWGKFKILGHCFSAGIFRSYCFCIYTRRKRSA